MTQEALKALDWLETRWPDEEERKAFAIVRRALAPVPPVAEWRDNHFIAGMVRVANQVRDCGQPQIADKIMKLLGDRFAKGEKQ